MTDTRVVSFLNRLPSGATCPRSDIETVFGIVAGFREKAAKIGADTTLSAEGKRLAREKALKDGAAAHMQQLRDRNAGALQALRTKRESLAPTKPSDETAIGEMRRAELRTYMRSLPPGERVQFALQSDDHMIVDAVLFAPAALSGLDEQVKGRLRERVISERFGAQLRNIEADEETLSNVGAAITIAEADLQRITERETLAA